MGASEIKVGAWTEMNIFVIVLYFLLFFLNLFCVWSRKRNRVVLLLTYAVLFFLCINNVAYGDAKTYRTDYEIIQRDSWEPGYILLRMFSYAIGITDYQVFLAVLFAFSSLFLMLGFRSMGVNLHIVYTLGMFFICPWMFVIIRFFVGISVAIFAMKFLFQRNYIQYVIWITISVLFHKSMAVFILVLFVRLPYKALFAKKDKIWRIVISLVIAASLCVLTYTFVKKEFLFSAALLNTVAMISDSAAECIGIYMGRITRWGAVPVIMVYIVNCLMAFLMKKETSNKNAVAVLKKDEADRENQFIEIAWRVSLIFAVFLPFDVLSVNFGRFNIVPTVFNVVALSQLTGLKKRKYHKVLVAFFCLMLCWAVTGWINFDINIFDYVNQCGLFLK